MKKAKSPAQQQPVIGKAEALSRMLELLSTKGTEAYNDLEYWRLEKIVSDWTAAEFAEALEWQIRRGVGAHDAETEVRRAIDRLSEDPGGEVPIGPTLGDRFMEEMLRQKHRALADGATKAGIASGASRRQQAASPTEIRAFAIELLAKGVPKRDIAGQIAGQFSVTSRRVNQILGPDWWKGK